MNKYVTAKSSQKDKLYIYLNRWTNLYVRYASVRQNNMTHHIHQTVINRIDIIHKAINE